MDPCFISAPLRLINVNQNAKWTQNGRTVAGGNDKGIGLHQLCNPYGFYIDDDQVMYIADSQNDRVVKWNCGDKIGEVVAGGHGKGDASNQLNCPTDVAVDKDGKSLIICDYKNRRVVRWPLRRNTSGETIISNIDCHGLAMDKNGFLYVTDYKQNEVRRYQMSEPHGRVVAGGKGQGNRLDQFNGPIYLFVGRDNSVYVSDEQNHRVMKWREGSKEGIVVAGGRQKGNGLEQLSEPAKVIVDSWNNIYVADWGNHRIMSWPREATQGHAIVDANVPERQWKQLKHPISLAFDSRGNLYVTNQWNHEVLKFDIVQNS
jgi:sugar lactone lactonase YvrE